MVYRVTERRLQRDSALRERILQLGLRRVAEGGFAALTMQALADDAGSPPAACTATSGAGRAGGGNLPPRQPA